MADPLFDISGRRALVAGGARGLGQSFVELLAARGVQVVVADILEKEGRDVVAGLEGEGHAFVRLDITDEKSVADAVEFSAGKAHGLDIVLNSVGIARFKPATELTVEEFAMTMAVNVTGAYALSRCAGMRMMDDGISGSIVHIASVSSVVSNPNYAAYATSKAAMSQLVRVLAREWATHDITVNALGPAVTPTALAGPILEDEAFRTRSLAQIPMGRFGTPEDLFGAFLLLVSPAGRFITGQTLFVDGGRTLV
jgi:NAD(P)-dependent dehydrogenase (short-subunit alcohol dehydrogenase family)